MQQSELQELGQHIQAKLQQLHSPIRLRIRCAFREEALLVLAEHLLHVEPDPRQTFTTIEAALQDYTPELMKSGLVRSGIGGVKFLPVRIYLRVAGYQQPYDSFVFSLKPAAPSVSANPPIPAFAPPPIVVTPLEVATPPEVQVESEIVPEIVEVAPLAGIESAVEVEFAEEIEPVAEVEPAEEIEPVAEIEPAAEVELVEEQPELDDSAIAEVVLLESIELEPVVISETAVDEPVFGESANVWQPPALEEPIPHATELPIAEEVIVEPPTIALEDPLVEPEAIADFLLLEEISLDLEEITPSQEVAIVPEAFVPEAIAPIVDSVTPVDTSPIGDESSLAQDEIQDELESAILPEEPVAEELIEEPIAEEPIAEEPIAEESFDPVSLAEIEPVDEPENFDALPLTELDENPSESSLALGIRETDESRETFEPEKLAIDSIAPAGEIVAVDSAIEEKTLTEKPDPDVKDPTTQISTVLAPKDSGVESPAKPLRASPPSSSSIMLGTAIALFGLLGGWYVLSRPCVLGSRCEPLQQAQQLSQTAFQSVQSTDSAIAIAKAYDDLGTANKLLTSIPVWSGQHQAAQTLIAENDAKSAVIGQLVRTLRKGNEAANRSQNPPHPLPEWREIQRLWRESIAALEKIPNNTAIYPVAQRKATEYRANLDDINKRVIVEQQAQEEVENAKKTAQLAETRTGIATSAEGWQDVYASWQAAISLLKNVPTGAAARLEAEELLKIYQSKQTAAGIRRNQENIAIGAYTEAIAQAEKAQRFEQKNQWQNAIAAWESAVANVQKVSQGTTPHAQAQPLITTYQTALTQAQGGLQVSEAIQAAKPALDRTCGGNPKVCQYDASPTAMRVQITYGYDQMVESAMISAQAQGNSTAQAGVVSQVNTFLQELALISQTAQVPIDLYNANGSKFGTYSPKASGFIPQ